MKVTDLIVAFLCLFTCFLVVSFTFEKSNHLNNSIYYLKGRLVADGKPIDGGYNFRLFKNERECKQKQTNYSYDSQRLGRDKFYFIYSIDLRSSQDMNIAKAGGQSLSGLLRAVIDKGFHKIELDNHTIKFEDQDLPKRFPDNFCISLSEKYEIVNDTIILGDIIIATVK